MKFLLTENARKCIVEISICYTGNSEDILKSSIENVIFCKNTSKSFNSQPSEIQIAMMAIEFKRIFK